MHHRDDDHDDVPAIDQDLPVGGDEVYLPFAGLRRRGGRDLDDEDLDLIDEPQDDAPQVEVLRMRPPPAELSRRDRREWRRLEVARINREAKTVVSRRHGDTSGWSGGFIRNPPRHLGRKGRKAWLAAEQEATTQWWVQRRGATHDIDARAAGAAIVALLIGIAVIAGVIAHRHSTTTAAAPPPVMSAASTPTPGTAALLPASQLVPGATGPVQVNSRNPAVGLTPKVAPPIAGQWQPTPAGGIPASTPTAAAAIKPAAVKLVMAPTGPITPADQESPQAVVTAWLTRTCPSSWRDPFGADVTRGKALETATAWELADPVRDTAGAALWRTEVLVHQQTRQCGNISVTVSPDQPLTAGGGFVLYSAARVVTSTTGHLPVTVEGVSGARRVIHAGGRWFVDVPVVGG